MANGQLIDYIKQQLQQGISREQIRQSLLASGWEARDIDKTFDAIAQGSNQHQKRKWKKIIFIVIGVIIILIVGILFLPRFLNLFVKDIKTINDSDLQLQKVLIADKDNAYFDLTKIGNAIYEPKDKSQTILDMVSGKIWDDKIAEEIVSQNTKAFEYFAQAAHKTKYQNPESADPLSITPNMVLMPTNSWKQMALLSAIRALYLAKQGKSKEALDEALNSVRIGQKIQESQATLIEYLVAMAMKEFGLETVQKIIPSSKLTSVELKQYVQELNQYYKNKKGLITAFKEEYYSQSWIIDSIANGNLEALKSITGEEGNQNPEIIKKIKDTYYFQPNRTKLLFADNARANIQSVNEPCGELKTTGVQKIAPTYPAKLYIEKNAIGEILYDIIAVSLTSINAKRCQEDLLVGATQTIIAIKAYKNDTNNYPASLNNLIPKYISSVPQDPFDGKPLKYSTTKKIIYSVGKDLQDSGGSVGDDWKNMANPTFKIDF